MMNFLTHTMQKLSRNTPCLGAKFAKTGNRLLWSLREHKLVFPALLLLATVSCSRNDAPENSPPSLEQVTTAAVSISEAVSDANQRFNTLTEQFLTERWALFPNAAQSAGVYDYDNQMTVPNEAQRILLREHYAKYLLALQQFNTQELSSANAIDLRLMLDYLQASVWEDEVFRAWQWNSANYNVAGAFGLLLNTNYKALEQRLQSFYERMENVPAYYQAAKENLQALSEPHLQLAIQQNQGAIGVFDRDFRELVQTAPLNNDQKISYNRRADQAVASINDYIDFLQQRQQAILGDANLTRSFRIGAELYEEKFQRDLQSSFTAAEIYQKAQEMKAALHEEMTAITRLLWPKYFPSSDIPEDSLLAIRNMIDILALEHVERENFVSAIRAQIPELEAFVLQHDLLDMDASRLLVVRETPEYQRGVAGASINAPGPYDPAANTYYNVTPLDNYDDAGAESYLREYNNRTLQILNIHEAVPGHYTQLMHANKSISRIKRLFGSGAMTEGWALYAEKMMLEAGYGNGEPELTLMYDKWLLRSVVNAIIDYDIHVNNASEEEVLTMLQREAFQEQSEATAKWRRATLSQVQLASYFTGFIEIVELREELKQKLGNSFQLKEFHNQFLSYGNAPVKYIRELML